ncbi:MAG: FAD:protein FMN transferase [Spirochaetota bacterium]
MKINPLIKLMIALVLISAAALWYGCSRDNSAKEPGRIKIGGTNCWLRAHKAPPQNLLEQAESQVRFYEQSLNDEVDGSQILDINAAAGERPVRVDAHVFEILRKSLNFARLSDGRYDPSAAPLYDLWRKTTVENQTPSRNLVYSALEHVDYTRIRTNKGMQHVYLPDKRMQISMQPGLDGFVVDKAAELLQRNGVADVCISKGIVRRSINGNSQFTFSEEILYENITERNVPVCTLKNLKARCLVSLYARQHLLIDLISGYPVKNGLVCLVSTGPEAYAAEVLAFTVATGDLHSGIALVEEIPFFEVLCITDQKEIICTSGFESHLSDIDSEYTLRVFDSRAEEDIPDERIAYFRSVVPFGTADGKNIFR